MHTNCPVCYYDVAYEDIDGYRVKHTSTNANHAIDRLYVRFSCPDCEEILAYLLETHSDDIVVHICTWDSLPCGYQNCPYCLTSTDTHYNTTQAVICDDCNHSLDSKDSWVYGETTTSDYGTKKTPMCCPNCDSQQRTKIGDIS